MEFGSGPNHELSLTGDDCIPLTPSHFAGPAGHPLDFNPPKTVIRDGSENDPIL